MGERLGVGVTLVLTIEISRGALQSVMPICGELLWLEIFFLLNLAFTVISLLESTVVLGLAFATAENLLPPPLQFHKAFRGLLEFHKALRNSIRRYTPRVADATGDKSDGSSIAAQFSSYATEGESLAGFLLRSSMDVGGEVAATAAAKAKKAASEAAAVTGAARFAGMAANVVPAWRRRSLDEAPPGGASSGSNLQRVTPRMTGGGEARVPATPSDLKLHDLPAASVGEAATLLMRQSASHEDREPINVEPAVSAESMWSAAAAPPLEQPRLAPLRPLRTPPSLPKGMLPPGITQTTNARPPPVAVPPQPPPSPPGLEGRPAVAPVRAKPKRKWPWASTLSNEDDEHLIRFAVQPVPDLGLKLHHPSPTADASSELVGFTLTGPPEALSTLRLAAGIGTEQRLPSSLITGLISPIRPITHTHTDVMSSSSSSQIQVPKGTTSSILPLVTWHALLTRPPLVPRGRYDLLWLLVPLRHRRVRPRTCHAATECRLRAGRVRAA